MRPGLRRPSPFAPLDQTAELALVERLAGQQGRPVPSTPAEGPVAARKDHGRWVADCPDCRGAWWLRDGQQTVACGACLNVANLSRRRPVNWS
jgi:hypothetical protein